MRITEGRLRKIIQEEVNQIQKAEVAQTAAAIKANPSILVAVEDQVDQALKNPEVVELIKKAAALKGITPEKAARIAASVESNASLSEIDAGQGSANGVGAMILPAGAAFSWFLRTGNPTMLAGAIGLMALGWLLDKVADKETDKSEEAKRKRNRELIAMGYYIEDPKQPGTYVINPKYK
jgi:hypothetical protein